MPTHHLPPPTRPFATEPLVNLAFAFGMAVKMNPADRPAGILSDLATELTARGVWRDLTARMDPDMTTRISQAVVLDRAAARAGNRQRR